MRKLYDVIIETDNSVSMVEGADGDISLDEERINGNLCIGESGSEMGG